MTITITILTCVAATTTFRQSNQRPKKGRARGEAVASSEAHMWQPRGRAAEGSWHFASSSGMSTSTAKQPQQKRQRHQQQQKQQQQERQRERQLVAATT